jgi:hypothetical protein
MLRDHPSSFILLFVSFVRDSLAFQRRPQPKFATRLSTAISLPPASLEATECTEIKDLYLIMFFLQEATEGTENLCWDYDYDYDAYGILPGADVFSGDGACYSEDCGSKPRVGRKATLGNGHHPCPSTPLGCVSRSGPQLSQA